METLDLVQGLSHISFVMHEKSQADTSDLVYVVSLESGLSTTQVVSQLPLSRTSHVCVLSCVPLS